jgi:hypothetical protein
MPPTLRSSASRIRQWASASINRAGYLRKWLILGIAIGIIAGLGAVVFYLALDYAGRFLLGYLADYQVPQPARRRRRLRLGQPLLEALGHPARRVRRGFGVGDLGRDVRAGG